MHFKDRLTIVIKRMGQYHINQRLEMGEAISDSFLRRKTKSPFHSLCKGFTNKF